MGTATVLGRNADTLGEQEAVVALTALKAEGSAASEAGESCTGALAGVCADGVVAVDRTLERAEAVCPPGIHSGTRCLTVCCIGCQAATEEGFVTLIGTQVVHTLAEVFRGTQHIVTGREGAFGVKELPTGLAALI
jgi:hypothetical protein